MTSKVELSIAIATLKPHVQGDTLEAQFKSVFSRCDGEHLWFTTSEDTRFRCGVAAVMSTMEQGSDDWILIERALKALLGLNALLSGVPVDLDAIVEETNGALPLMAWWHEYKPS